MPKPRPSPRKSPQPPRNARKLKPTGAAGTKSAKILSLVQRPDGATSSELEEATGWVSHSVRGYISGTLRKRMGLDVQRIERKDGAKAYRAAAKKEK